MQHHTQNDSRTVSVETAGAMLGISRPTAYKLARLDQFPTPIIRLGRRMVVSREAVEELLARRKPETVDKST